MARLVAILSGIGPVAVAVSGGIDSLTLATAAHRTLGDAAIMLHATSPAVPAEATARTASLARAEGWRLEVFDAGEFADSAYIANPINRCFFCKTNLYEAISRRTKRLIVSGTNSDDLSDYRPGLEAARARSVRHPFVEAGIAKRDVRALARALGLGALAELPASPCLSSRIETGIAIAPETLAIVHAAEKRVAEVLGARTVRCRVRADRVVIELDAATLETLDPAVAGTLLAELTDATQPLGRFRPVSFARYQTGSAFVGVRQKAPE